MSIELSAVLIVGLCRARAQRVVDALCAQTALQSMEIVVVDLAEDSVPRLKTPPESPIVYISRQDIQRWGTARLEAVKAARSPVIAFIEDHCFPSPDWARTLIDAHKEPWAAVGYAFTNANPESYISRASILARYGLFVHPARGGPANYLSGNNISYKREILLALGERLEPLLDIDFNLQQELMRDGMSLFVEAGTLAAHQNYTSLSGECRAGRPYCRLLAARRARAGAWGRTRQIIYGLLTPLGAPAIRLARLAFSLGERRRRPLWSGFILAFPAIVIMYFSDALGESLGYLLGAGNAEDEVVRYELNVKRCET